MLKKIWIIALMILFVLFAPAALSMAIRNIDSLLSIIYFTVVIVISFLFFHFVKFKSRKGLIICFSLVGIFLVFDIYKAFQQPSIAERRRFIAGFPDIVHWNTTNMEEPPLELFTGNYAFYNAKDNTFSSTRASPESISVIVFYWKNESTHRYNYETSKQYHGTVTEEHINISLMNVKTKRCFAQATFSAGISTPIPSGESRRVISYTDPQVKAFISNYFTK